jgi:hypothetical protein
MREANVKGLKLHHHILLMVAILMLLLAPAASAEPSVASAVTRTLEPVIVKGADLSMYLNVPVTQIFVYAYHGGGWSQLPAQVDEVNASGEYVAYENGLLDDNDEIVFMARDLGDSSGGAAPDPGGGTAIFSWYELTVTDPTHPGDQGWAYVVRPVSIAPTPTADYVQFDGSSHRITGSNYTLGFATPKAWLDYMTLGTSETDILDRAPKVRLCKGFICLNESLFPDTPDGLIKDGPVRAILRDGRVLAYGWMALSVIPITISPPIPAPDFVRFSTDLNADAVGATFYNGVVPGGVPVDGVPDVVPATPFSSWSQLSLDTGVITGTIVQAFDVSQMGGTPTNYYVDDSQIDNQDTGDQRHYGDDGVRVDDPNLSFTFRTQLYFLDGAQPNVGETYAGYAAQPLQTVAEWHKLDMPFHIYLPLVIR